MPSRESQCEHKSTVKLGDKQWEWCSIYHGEVSKQTCKKCEYKRLYKKPLRIRREIIS